MILTYFNVSFLFFLHSWARDPGLGPKAAAGRARAGRLVTALGPGPGSRAQECKKNKNSVGQIIQITLKCVGIHVNPFKIR